ncbi:methyl-CpG-binding domain protein 2-like [Mustela erminea]|uniref:methyl-CpG-binding domain protein 2-like n=1 Tax=Mustela erminea TaxID=36723 RepID=UPI0013873318|nr:methyl-CpG-binding domain protein 2-like [Mustela erminea]
MGARRGAVYSGGARGACGRLGSGAGGCGSPPRAVPALGRRNCALRSVLRGAPEGRGRGGRAAGRGVPRCGAARGCAGLRGRARGASSAGPGCAGGGEARGAPPAPAALRSAGSAERGRPRGGSSAPPEGGRGTEGEGLAARDPSPSRAETGPDRGSGGVEPASSV